jgi:6-phosphogluconolactonase
MALIFTKIAKITACSVFILISSNTSAQSKAFADKEMNKMYVGTYTKKEGHVDGKAEGIYLLHQDPDNGSLTNCGTQAKIINPSFVKTGRQGKFLFAVSELGPGDDKSGYIYSYQIQENGNLKEISKLSTGGHAPCHIALDRSGKFVFVSNYMGGVVATYKVNSDGALEKVSELKLPEAETAHAHTVKISGDNRTAYVADLGNDRILVYEFDVASGTLSKHENFKVQLPEGAGPRHLSLSRNGNFVYSMNELNSTVTTYKVLKGGALEIVQTLSSLPESYLDKNSGADIHIGKDGKYLYASNRGHNSIAIFSIDQVNGKLKNVDFVPVAGKTPRNFAISPFGKYLYAASQDTGNITTYTINPENGKLKIQEPIFEINTPVCLEFQK